MALRARERFVGYELGLVCQERDESEQEYRPDLKVLTSYADDGPHQVPQVISRFTYLRGA
jgi:hypothetical protein